MQTVVSDLKRILEKRLSTHRYQHTLGVAEESYQLGAYLEKLKNKDSQENFSFKEKAYLAGLLHDYAKELKTNQLLELANSFEIEINYVDQINPHLLHARVGAHLVKKEFSTQLSESLNLSPQDLKEILKAISSHTLGQENMSSLEKVVFVADATEKNRPSSTREKIKQEIFFDKEQEDLILDLAVLELCRSKIESLLKRKKTVHPITLKAYNYYLLNSFKIPKNTDKYGQ